MRKWENISTWRNKKPIWELTWRPMLLASKDRVSAAVDSIFKYSQPALWQETEVWGLYFDVMDPCENNAMIVPLP